MLPVFPFGGSLPASLTYCGAGTIASFNSTTPSFSGINFSTAGSRIIVIAGMWSSSAGGGLSSMTIGGVAATIVVNHFYAAAQLGCFIAWAAVPTGSSGTVSSSFSNVVNDMVIAAYALYNLQSNSAYATNAGNSSSATTSLTTTCNTPASGFIIAVAGAWNSGGFPSISFTAGVGTDNSQGLSVDSYAAGHSGTSGGGTWTVTFTTSSSSNLVIGAASWH